METSLVTVVIPAYNAANYLGTAIDSALGQTYSNVEVVVVNDGSTDETAAVAAKYDDKRVKLISKPNGGMSSARNAGLALANGEFIAFLDADDYWMPNKIAKQVTLLQENTDIGFCSTLTRVETPSGLFVNSWECPVMETSTLHTIFANNAAIAGSASSVLARRQVQTKAGWFDEKLKGLEDTDMWMRYASHAEYLCIPEMLTVILKRPDSVSRNLKNMRQSAAMVYTKNRHLLDKPSQKKFWRTCYTNMLCDYAKWEARSGLKWIALGHLVQAFAYAPLTQARLCASLSIAVILNRPL
tara:strand:- start:549 stop:1445 length:897 start_codon:yes stop_codon:yes gene_type:complete